MSLVIFFAHIGNFHLLDNIQDGVLLSVEYCHVLISSTDVFFHSIVNEILKQKMF